MSVVIDIVNEIDKLRVEKGVRAVEKILGCVLVDEYNNNSELKEKFATYSDYLSYMYKEYVDNEEITRQNWIKIDCVLDIESYKKDEFLCKTITAAYNDIGLDFSYCNIDIRAYNEDLAIYITNPEKITDNKKTLDLLHNNPIGNLNVVDKETVKNMMENKKIVRIEPRSLTRNSSKIRDYRFLIRVIANH